MLVFRPMRRKFRCPVRNGEWWRLFSTVPRLFVLSLPKCIKSVPDLSMLGPLAVANFRCPITKKSYFNPRKHGCYIMYIVVLHQRPAKLYMRFSGTYTNCVKGKAVPLQAWSGPEGSRKLRFPDFMTTAQGGGKVVSLTHRSHLPSGNSPGTHFC